MKNLILSIFILIGFGLQAQTDVYFNIEHFLGTAPFAYNQTATNNLNQNFKVTRLEYYIAEIKLIHDGGMETAVPNFWILVDASSSVNHFLGNFNITALEAIEFGVGVDSAHNHLDPTSYSVTHPLGPKSPSMHWGWSAGYRFLAMEGKSGSGLNLTFEIHALGDNNYNLVNLPTTGNNSGSEININIEADYEMGLKKIDISSGPIVHDDVGLAAEALLNFNSNVFSISGSNPNGINTPNVLAVLNIYPNPSTGQVNFELNKNTFDNVTIVVTDLGGHAILRKDIINTTKSQLSIPNSGMYIMTAIVDGNQVFQKKISIIK